MTDLDRRNTLRLLGGAGLSGALPMSIERALAVPALHRTGTIADVEHIVVLMQENRSFDHLFGTLRGVRGFNDPRAARLPSGRPVWNQPNGTTEVLPFRPPVDNVGLAFLPDPPHGWNDTHAAWNGGRHDAWVPNKGLVSMTYHTRHDIPFHYALADAFTICDAYHCSVLGPTDPNRYHLWSGWVGNDGMAGGPVITNAEAGYDWVTFPERLLAAGISWKVYQDVGVGLNASGYWGWTEDPYIGNYGDNALLYFHQYQNAPEGSPLALNARSGTNISAAARDPNRLLDQFRADVSSGKLPSVTWLVAPEAYSEHPNHPANYGAWYVSQVIDILAAHPEVFGKTALFINYDEEGGFFDHMTPPVPPMPGAGASTVSTVNEIYPAGDAKHPSGPYGLGMRVPMIVVSPWSKGGWVNSQVFDHTSIIRFIEARFAKEHPAILETNITPWRRAVTGDLTSAFDFENGHRRPAQHLPGTNMPPDLVRHPDLAIAAPATPSLPKQEAGVRPARALPYTLQAHGQLDAARGTFSIDMGNVGQAAAVFQVRSGNAADAPRHYTVEPQRLLSDGWKLDATGQYDLEVRGPNGFFRAFRGSLAGGQLLVKASVDEGRQALRLHITNTGTQAVNLLVHEAYFGQREKRQLHARESTSSYWPMERAFGWYDLRVTIEGDSRFLVQFAGHIENGRDSISDPAMSGWR